MSATFILSIDCGNAAFAPTASDRNAEIARILRDAASRLELIASVSRAADDEQIKLFDTNGNHIGHAEFRSIK